MWLIVFLATAFWVGLIVLVEIGLSGRSPKKKDRYGKEMKSSFFRRAIYFIARPVTIIFVILGAICMMDDINDFLKK